MEPFKFTGPDNCAGPYSSYYDGNMKRWRCGCDKHTYDGASCRYGTDCCPTSTETKGNLYCMGGGVNDYRCQVSVVVWATFLVEAKARSSTAPAPGLC